MTRKKISLLTVLFCLFPAAAGAGEPLRPAAEESWPILLAQRKAHDLGNCFSVRNCKGDSIGMMWVDFPDYCKSMGGRSWMDQYGKCYDLPPGPNNIQGP